MAQDFSAFLLSVAGMESSGGSTSRNVYGLTRAGGFSNAAGLSYQEQTARATGLAQQNYTGLSRALGRAPTEFEQYIAWNQGVSGATKIFNADPNAPASSAIINPAGNMAGYDPATTTVGDYLKQMASRWDKAGGTGGSAINAPAIGGGTSEGWTEYIANYFVRGALIVLGYIFVNRGLAMFGVGAEPQPILIKDVTKRPPPAKQEPAIIHQGASIAQVKKTVRQERRRAVQGHMIREAGKLERKRERSRTEKMAREERLSSGGVRARKTINVKPNKPD